MSEFDARPLRVLAITKIYPNAVEPTSAQFNRQQLLALSALCRVDILATIPWFPGAGFMASSTAGKLTHVPRRETIDGLDIRHPRTLFIPRMAEGSWAPLYVASLAPIVLRYRSQVDVVLGTWAYPDGVAAIVLGRLLGVPTVVKLHGSDMNVIAKRKGPRRQLRFVLPRANKVVAVSRALADEARGLGVGDDRICIVMNGVDADLFHPRDRAEARRRLRLPETGRIALYVGNLKETKGVVDLADAFPKAPGVHFAVVGDGDARGALEKAAASEPARMTLAGARPLAEIGTWMAACDVLVLPSWAEGTPNVVLEALASGRKVVATRVGGIPDLVTSDTLGELVSPRDPDALAATIARVANADYDPLEVARLGARGGWAASGAALHAVLESAARST